MNTLLSESLQTIEKHCWANAQYPRREYLEISGIPSLVRDNDLIARLFFFLSKSPWCSPLPLKFESLKTPPLQKERPQVSFLCIYRTTAHPNNFRLVHCYEVTPVKKCNKPLLQKSEIKIFDQKRFIKNLFKVKEKNNSGVLKINHIMCKLLTLSTRLQFNC